MCHKYSAFQPLRHFLRNVFEHRRLFNIIVRNRCQLADEGGNLLAGIDEPDIRFADPAILNEHDGNLDDPVPVGRRMTRRLQIHHRISSIIHSIINFLFSYYSKLYHTLGGSRNNRVPILQSNKSA